METIISIISKEFPQYKVKDYTKYVKTQLDYIKLTDLALLPQASDSVVVLDTNNEIVKDTCRFMHARCVVVINKGNGVYSEFDDVLQNHTRFKNNLFNPKCSICYETPSSGGASCNTCLQPVCNDCLFKCFKNNIKNCPCCRDQMIDDTTILDCLIQYIECHL